MAVSNEVKVGVLVVIALGALGWLSVKSGSFGIASATTSMRSLHSGFTNVDGVKIGTPVKMAGVDIGEVTAIELRPNGTAQVSFKVRKAVALPADVTSEITSSGIIGDKFIALVPGAMGSAGQGELLAESVTDIPSGGQVDPGQMGNNFAKVSDDLKQMTETLNKVLGNPENAAKLQQIIDGLSTFSTALGSDSSNTLASISRMATNFEKISDQLAQGKGPLGQLIMGTGDGGTSNALADISAAAKDLREVMAKINNGDGTLGKLVNDPQTAEKINNALDSLGSVSERLEQFRTEVALEGGTFTNEQAGKGEFSLTLQPRPTRFYVLGATADGLAASSESNNDRTGPYYNKDFGSTTKLTVQFGQVYQNALLGQDVAVRVGLKNSTGGVGLDTYGKLPYFDKNVKYSADVYDFSGNDTPGSSSPHVDIAARADLIGKTVYGVVGYDNVLNQEYGSPLVGVGLRFQDDDLKYILGKAL